MKGLLITITVLITFILGSIVWLWLGSGDSSTPTDFTDLPGSTGGYNPVGGSDIDKIMITTEEGDVIINDVRALPIAEQRDEDIYEVSGFDPYDYSPDFNIIFSESQGSFALSINKAPFTETRQAAEQHLQSILGISASQMCQLNVFVGVPYDVDPTVGGGNLGFSFCPGSVSLE